MLAATSRMIEARYETPATDGGPPMLITYDSNGSDLDVVLGQELDLQLPENPTTGYRWRKAAESSEQLQVTEQAFEVASDGCGAPGVRTWKVICHQAGAHHLVFEQARAWQKTPVRTFSVRINVLPKR